MERKIDNVPRGGIDKLQESLKTVISCKHQLIFISETIQLKVFESL